MATTAKVKVSAWGNSFGVRLPRKILLLADVKGDTELDVRVEKGALILTPQKSKRKTLKQLLKNVRPVSDPEIRAWINMKPVGKEIW
ncbi:MAG: AbrB/MazE/SpoVT family DNA-binding domain-containing protein [bacterium]|nr:AbrB/MazE/SpoVT family DNA-binding domain-containing protein [bacterium]